MAAAGRRLSDRGGRRGPRERRQRRPRRALPAAGRAPGVRVLAKGTGTRWPTAACSSQTRRSWARRRGRGAWSGASPSRPRPSAASEGNRLHELVALAAALDEMGWRTAGAGRPRPALDLILAVGAARTSRMAA